MSNPDQAYKRIKTYAVAADDDGANQIVAAVPGESICVLGYSLSITPATTTADNTTFKSASTAISGAMFSSAATLVAPNSEIPYMETAKGEALNLDNAAGIDVYGHITIGFR